MFPQSFPSFCFPSRRPSRCFPPLRSLFLPSAHSSHALVSGPFARTSHVRASGLCLEIWESENLHLSDSRTHVHSQESKFTFVDRESSGIWQLQLQLGFALTQHSSSRTPGFSFPSRRTRMRTRHLSSSFYNSPLAHWHLILFWQLWLLLTFDPRSSPYSHSIYYCRASTSRRILDLLTMTPQYMPRPIIPVFGCPHSGDIASPKLPLEIVVTL
jgi:hypothetical protein